MGLTMSSQSSDVFSEAGTSLGDWGKLPYVALALIFSYLPDRDKFNASLVNRMWGEGFSWPGNWRHREMIFYGACEDTVAKEKAFADRFGAQLKSLRLRCWSPAQGPALDIYLRKVAEVLDIISLNSSLRELHVADVEGLGYTDDELITVNDLLFESERRAVGKARMVIILENLIQ
ncbi:F-box only protein 39-like isoform X2 [Athalia rosae]|uniref:F-box only protein 39-like isoform X2 n=1 Tax=Athalia rosae TaxID=37344 RepID=UPI00203496E5|nr:F-box only protein 39-like isoform X2 [Athalia rosae]